jgi:N-acetylmuramidase
MERFIKKHGIDQALSDKGWADFARVYNGPTFADNDYDGKLRDNFSRYSQGALPDIIVRSAQILLMYLGYLDSKPGSIDGVLGKNTRGALSKQGLTTRWLTTPQPCP